MCKDGVSLEVQIIVPKVLAARENRVSAKLWTSAPAQRCATATFFDKEELKHTPTSTQDVVETGEGRRQRTGKKETHLFDIDHQNAFTMAGLKYPPDFSSDLKFFEKIQHLCERQQEVLGGSKL